VKELIVGHAASYPKGTTARLDSDPTGDYPTRKAFAKKVGQALNRQEVRAKIIQTIKAFYDNAEGLFGGHPSPDEALADKILSALFGER